MGIIEAEHDASPFQQVRIYAGMGAANSSTTTTTTTAVDSSSAQKDRFAGRLCLWSPDNAEDNADNYEQFVDYRRTLRLKCAPGGSAGRFTWTPESNTPDALYYQVAQ